MTEYISFPKLGITLNADSVAFTFGNHEVYWYGVLIALGFVLAIISALVMAKKYGMSQDTIMDMVIFGAPSAIIGARLYYVIFQWENYASDPWEIFRIWNGGLAIYGGILVAILVAYIYCRIKKENLPLLCDICAISLLIGQSIGRWGNFFNQEAFGTNTTLPWGMTGSTIESELASMAAEGMNVNPALPVHPTFLYESLWNLMFIILFYIFFSKRKFDGQIMCSYLISYGVGRFFIEFLRTDSLYLGPVRVSQIVAIGCVVAGTALMIYNLKKKERKLTLPVNPEALESEEKEITQTEKEE